MSSVHEILWDCWVFHGIVSILEVFSVRIVCTCIGTQVCVNDMILQCSKITSTFCRGRILLYFKNKFSNQISKYIYASKSYFKTMISWLFLLFNYIKTLLIIIIYFLSQITILESINTIQESQETRLKSSQSPFV